MTATMTKDRAETIALQAVAYLLQDGEGIQRFLTESGFDPGELRTRLGDPALLVAVCDFVLRDDVLTVAFCRSIGCSSDVLHHCVRVLEMGWRPVS